MWEKYDIPLIAITGGPCGGKTTALAYLVEKLTDLGYRVFVVSEVATRIITGGVPDIKRLAKEDRELFRVVQYAMLMKQLGDERFFLELAEEFRRRGEKVVILCDRGAADVRAYVTTEEFKAFMETGGLTWADALGHYTAALHMTTAANGAREHYTRANNKARLETPRQAIAADARTQAAWTGTPHLRILDNATGFDEKLHRLWQELACVLGIPVPLEIERKYLLAQAPDLAHPAFRNAATDDIVQYYLRAPEGEQHRVRQRDFRGHPMYFETWKKRTDVPGKRIETERIIGPLQFLKLLEERDERRAPIRKRRTCFLYRNQYFELDHFLDLGLWLLEIELTEQNQVVRLPRFVKVAKEVTDDPTYSNDALALLRAA